ncbi:MAG TPA: hypothetical protein PKY56_09210 [Candidatus Kapabacteria bacterium]|nr:hypothetical protein [Candidatus Kapabacteria bacterium]HPO63035.1 hypothetical protein [Candidatus Kapabacteria bacterium]
MEVLNAKYSNNSIIIEKKLNFDENEEIQVIVMKNKSKEKFFEFVDSISFDLPEDYKFDREEANDKRPFCIFK